MVEFFIIVLLLLLYLPLSKRVTKLEAAIKRLDSPTEQVKEAPPTPQAQPTPELAPEPVSEPAPASIKIVETPPPKPQVIQKKPAIQKKEPSQLFVLLRDNWIGVTGALAVVIGAVFFSLTAEIMKNPIARISALLLFSLFLVGTTFKLKKYKKWTPFCSWLTSIAGAIVLFVSFGAGGIEGLQCIHHPLMALIALCLGISFNLFLALRAASQFIASFHVILSLLTLCMVPQSPLLVLIGGVVSTAGLIASHRNKWELHSILITLTFSIQNTLCYFELMTLSPYLPIVGSLLVGCTAAMIHYKKAYQSPKFEFLPFCTHLLNWGLLAWNLFLYMKLYNWTPLFLGGAAAAGFVLARVAKRKQIGWLFHTDTILAQITAMAALIALNRFDLKTIDIALLVCIETLLFSFISNLQKERVLVRWGHAFHLISSFTVVAIAGTHGPQNDFFFYLRLGALTFVNWGYYAIAHKKRFLKDDFSYPLSSGLKLAASPIMLTGCAALFVALFFGSYSPWIPPFIMLTFVGLAFWKTKSKLSALDFTLLFSLVFLHIIQWNTLLTSTNLSIWNLVWVGVLDLTLIFGRFLDSKAYQNKLYCVAVYGLAIHAGLLTYDYTRSVVPLIPAVLYLAYSLIALELSKLKSVKSISHFFFQVGFGFMVCFLSNFILVHMQVQPVWKGMSLRWIIESLGLFTMGYWLFFPPNTLSVSKLSSWLHKSLIELSLGFLSLCIFLEFPDAWRPIAWASLAWILLVLPKTARFPIRLYSYSWAYLLVAVIHTTFLTYYHDKNTFLVFTSVALQIAYPLSCLKLGRIIKASDRLDRFVFRVPCLSLVLPIFIGVALMLYFNFEKALLTLLWVGLICLYFTTTLLMKSKRGMQISLGALGFCSLRLVLFDLTQQNLSVRALVFLGVGIIMLLISVLYKKFKYRFELHETT